MMVRRFFPALLVVVALTLIGVAGMGVAQNTPNNGFDSSGSFEVGGIEVDVRGDDAESARQAGWRLAQRKGWTKLAQQLAGSSNARLSDSTLDSIVTGIIVERENIGPDRYIARLGVLFDRAKAGALLGVSVQVTRSPPMMLLPLEWSGGAGRMYERNNAWQEAWGRFRSGNSNIDYVRPRGTGPDALLMNAGQTLRRGRGWWREVLDTYGAADVLIAEVDLRREYPGGPVTGVFTASHGPDRAPLGRFALRVNNGSSLDALLDAGVRRIDQIYQDALNSGKLKTDRLLAFRPPEPKTEEEAPEEAPEEVRPAPADTPAVAAGTAVSVQVDTPDSTAFLASEGALRGIPGVRSVTTSSTALGGVSVMRVTYDGSIGSLRSQLEGRGWTVQQGPGVLRISKASQSPPPPPQPSPTDGTGEE
ncbi:heavy-metal-associated domain-containing protein [Stakelama tenebrarum]|uniref:Heavy-metal-associated domain-containing protein n=1 Tax=Stakelama tenebrarum TaxID=2711215 RepID=A0A6G6Y5Z4_9SPHN|nr:heavy-metal-associated domain-containing protein [Sphingosinithalassobacter tenebrarum]QIG80319.1 heavy-metal-associated domain-containing protein [Sphingosinithalassobacter tenebrarum]